MPGTNIPVYDEKFFLNMMLIICCFAWHISKLFLFEKKGYKSL